MKKNGWPAFLWVVVMLLFAVCLAFGGTGMKAYEDWMEAFWKRKYESDFSKEMNRSMEVYLKDYAVDTVFHGFDMLKGVE